MRRKPNKSRGDHRGRVTVAPPRKSPEALPTVEEILEGSFEMPSVLEVSNTSGGEVTTSMDSTLLPGVFDTNAIILRSELDAFCPGYAQTIKQLENHPYPDLASAVYDRFERHLLSEQSRLKGAQTATIQVCLGNNGLVHVPAWADPVRIPTPAQFAHQCGDAVPDEVAYAELTKIVAEYRAKMLSLLDEESGVGYDESQIAGALVDFLSGQRQKRSEHLREMIQAIESLIEVRHVPEDGVIRIEYKIMDYAKLPLVLQRFKRECQKMTKDFAGWLFEGMEDFLKETFYWTDEQNEEFFRQHFAPLFAELSAAVKDAGERLSTTYVDEEQAETVGSPEQEIVTSTPELLDDIEQLVPSNSYQVRLALPWLDVEQQAGAHGLIEYRVNGHGVVYIASALSHELADIAARSAKTLLDRDIFNKLAIKAVKGVAGNKPYRLEKATAKGGVPLYVTPYDGFNLHKEDGGSAGNASRLYFALTRIVDVVGEVPEGVAPDARVILVVAKTDKAGQDRVLELINGSPARTAKRRGSGK